MSARAPRPAIANIIAQRVALRDAAGAVIAGGSLAVVEGEWPPAILFNGNAYLLDPFSPRDAIIYHFVPSFRGDCVLQHVEKAQA